MAAASGARAAPPVIPAPDCSQPLVRLPAKVAMRVLDVDDALVADDPDLQSID
jgi:hypothetical protein